MSWFVVGGIAIGATAGAIYGSQKGGDDVWKGALIGGAIGGTAGVGAGAIAGGAGAAGAAGGAGVAGAEGAGIAGLGGAEAAVAGGAGVGAAAPAGIMGAEGAAMGGSGLALGGAGLETGGAMAGGAGILGAEGVGAAGTTATAGGMGTSAGGMGLGQAGGFGSGATFGGSGTSFGTYGGAAVPEGGGLMNAGFAPGMQAPIQMIEAPAATEYAMFGGDTAPMATKEYAMFGGDTAPTATNVATKTPTQSPLKSGFDTALNWLSEPKNAMLTGVLGLGALSMFNQDNEDNFGGSTVTPAGYPLSPNFKPSRYQPTRTYVGGGEIYGDYDGVEDERFAKGGDTSDRSDKAFAEARRYQGMIDPRMNVQTPDTPDWVRSRGVYHDEDPDTKYQDALTAAQTRMGKAASRANVKLAAMQKPTPLGKLNLGPVVNNEKQKADTTDDDGLAGGGITSLGGYAHGGNPRLLRGPGDGMSDDIPASIADKQPARLADGEFVVPADVVSGLGNGSTEAGAKKLHHMMDKVRVDRTGTKKQGKQIKAEKYIPGMASGGIAEVKRYAGGNLVVNPETNEVGYWSNVGEWGQGGTWNPVTQEQYNQATAPAPTVNTTAQGYNPDYYNPLYYQNQLKVAQSKLSSAQDAYNQASQGIADYKANLPADMDLAAANPQLNDWYLKYLGRNIEGPGALVNIGHEYAIANSPEAQAWANNPLNKQFLASQADINSANQAISQAQPDVDRLAASSIKYDPYTIANRPSSAEPQFYGNIYKPEYENYARPGYDMNAQLGGWNNEYGGNAATTERQKNILNIAAAQQQAQQQSLASSQNAAMNSRQLINASVAAGKNQPPKEETKARKGGIMGAKRK